MILERNRILYLYHQLGRSTSVAYHLACNNNPWEWVNSARSAQRIQPQGQKVMEAGLNTLAVIRTKSYVRTLVFPLSLQNTFLSVPDWIEGV